ncbi:MAG: hypothetical protein F4Z28_18055 [Gammaproteobacteria bacterium]|nr:hypothetical protein [Gammaproteobacteria bacterium]
MDRDTLFVYLLLRLDKLEKRVSEADRVLKVIRNPVDKGRYVLFGLGMAALIDLVAGLLWQ